LQSTIGQLVSSDRVKKLGAAILVFSKDEYLISSFEAAFPYIFPEQSMGD
jgi:hypothetical protein